VQGLLLDIVVGIVLAGLVIMAKIAGSRWGGSYGKAIETALALTAGLTAAMIVLVEITDLVPDDIDQELFIVLVPAITIVLVAGTAYRLTERTRDR
jgi:chromate transport protein ChrA